MQQYLGSLLSTGLVLIVMEFEGKSATACLLAEGEGPNIKSMFITKH